MDAHIETRAFGSTNPIAQTELTIEIQQFDSVAEKGRRQVLELESDCVIELQLQRRALSSAETASQKFGISRSGKTRRGTDSMGLSGLKLSSSVC